MFTSRSNRFNITEWNGAFGDLGTLLPFLLAYITILKMNPSGLLWSFGISMIVVGMVYKTPFPVQPMKAVGTVSVGQAAMLAGVSASTVTVAALLTGLIWLVLGATGLARKLGQLIPSEALPGVIMGLGFVFMLEGIDMMRTSILESAVFVVLAMTVFNSRLKFSAMWLLLLSGILLALVKSPALWEELSSIRPAVNWPHFNLNELDLYSELWLALIFLVLPQLPLTFGNAYLAVISENNTYFPDRPVRDKQVAYSTGFMNVLSGCIGGSPMCHGAGGMAGHMAFGARTGGATIILGSILCLLGLLFADSILTILQLFPVSVLGVILFLAGLQLAMGSRSRSEEKSSRLLVLLTAGLTVLNVGLALIAAILAHMAAKKGWLKF